MRRLTTLFPPSSPKEIHRAAPHVGRQRYQVRDVSTESFLDSRLYVEYSENYCLSKRTTDRGEAAANTLTDVLRT